MGIPVPVIVVEADLLIQFDKLLAFQQEAAVAERLARPFTNRDDDGSTLVQPEAFFLTPARAFFEHKRRVSRVPYLTRVP